MPATDESTIVLRFENVSVSFDGVPALRNVSFEVPHGETRILFGAAGSGKTVALKTALGLIRPDSGSVWVLGKEITGLTEKQLYDVRTRIGMLFQESALFDSLTIAENVAYPLLNRHGVELPPEEVARRVREALRFVELEHTLEKLPSELSGGMRRRVAIARAVVTEPPLLLYDSPTAGLDPITATTILRLIVKQRDWSNTTNLIVTHRYQNGNLMANCWYNPQTGKLERERRADTGETWVQGRRTSGTRFFGFREGRLIFDGVQAELEASTDPYVAKFVGHNG
ncbi:MAG: ABC transporter ATP-binding protein [Bryobacteraceae bacterium]